ncbi:MAG: repeat protein, partial [Phycisphaerales bacterium]|nr:repeat protein [Phycisphaerales bacterium]
MAKNKKQRRGAGRVATAAAAARAAVEVLEARTHFTASVSGQIYKEVDVGGVLTRVGLANWTVYSRPFYYDGVNPAVPGPTSPVQTASDGTYHINTDTAGYTYWVYILGAGPSGPYTISGGGYSFSDYNGDGLNDAQYDYGGEGSTVYTDQDFRIAYPTTSPNTTPDRNNKLGDCDCPPVAAQDPVRYSDGQVFEGATDLSADGYGMPWAQARSWSNTPGYARLQTNGNGWVTDDTPTLVVGPDGSLGMVYSGAEAQWFDQVGGGTYAARHDALDTLAFGFADDGSGAQEVTYTSRADGTQIRFYNPFDTSLPALKRGAFKSQQAPGAPRLAVYSSDSAGRPTELRRSVTAGGVTTVESWKHDYLTSGSNAGKLQKVTLRRSTNGGTTWATVRQVAYTYYGGTAGASDAFGNLGDLRTAEVQDAAGAVIDTWYYRYYKSGDANGYAGG